MEVHSLCVFPGEVSKKTCRWEEQTHGIEGGVGEDDGDDPLEFGAEAGRNRGSSIGIGGEQNQPDQEGARDGDDVIFRPDVCD